MREAHFTRRLAEALASQLPQTAKGDFGLTRRYALRMVATLGYLAGFSPRASSQPRRKHQPSIRVPSLCSRNETESAPG